MLTNVVLGVRGRRILNDANFKVGYSNRNLEVRLLRRLGLSQEGTKAAFEEYGVETLRATILIAAKDYYKHGALKLDIPDLLELVNYAGESAANELLNKGFKPLYLITGFDFHIIQDRAILTPKRAHVPLELLASTTATAYETLRKVGLSKIHEGKKSTLFDYIN